MNKKELNKKYELVAVLQKEIAKTIKNVMKKNEEITTDVVDNTIVILLSNILNASTKNEQTFDDNIKKLVKSLKIRRKNYLEEEKNNE